VVGGVWSGVVALAVPDWAETFGGEARSNASMAYVYVANPPNPVSGNVVVDAFTVATLLPFRNT
jgi:hypothetical protein